MSQITHQPKPTSADRLPWQERASSEVQGIRRAITNREDELKVDQEVAPLMSELLARIDAFSEPAAPAPLSAPRLAGAADLTPQQRLSALSRSSAQLAEVIQQAPDETSRQRLLGLLHVLEGHLEMKREILLRVGTRGS